MAANEIKPDIIVFDLDETLWDAFADCLSLPLKVLRNGNIVDKYGNSANPFPEVEDTLKQLHGEGYTLALASRTDAIRVANELLTLLDWHKYFTYKEIYPGDKKTHFKRFHEQSGLPYTSMMFFDDEHRNIMSCGKLGVTCIHVPNGMDRECLQRGLRRFRSKQHTLSE